jgi:hypothetical protein
LDDGDGLKADREYGIINIRSGNALYLLSSGVVLSKVGELNWGVVLVGDPLFILAHAAGFVVGLSSLTSISLTA